MTRYARENYVFTKDGEQVVILPDIDQENKQRLLIFVLGDFL
mgnify:FL=1